MTFGSKYYSVDQIKDDQMRGACGMYTQFLLVAVEKNTGPGCLRIGC